MSLSTQKHIGDVCGALQGHAAPVEVALELYNILSESDTNLRQPVGLENQLLKNSLGSEVGQSILQLLQVFKPFALPAYKLADAYKLANDPGTQTLACTTALMVYKTRGYRVQIPFLLSSLHNMV